MPHQISRTTHGDAPLSTAKNPNTGAVFSVGEAEQDDVLIGRTVSINRPRAEVYAFWRRFENLPQFMENIESVTVVDASRSHWAVKGPAGHTIEWDSVITAEEPGTVIAWTSVEGSSVRNSGRVEFRDSSNGRGTHVSVTIAYDPPGGELGKLVAKLFQREPRVQARRDLRRFKQLMETGEVSTARSYIADEHKQ